MNFHTLPEPRDTPKNFFAFFVGSTQTEKSVARDVKDALTVRFVPSKIKMCSLRFVVFVVPPAPVTISPVGCEAALKAPSRLRRPSGRQAGSAALVRIDG